ncbi:MAG: UbiA prenyltransferase family protein [Candidatus Thermoplasmatota archaeon]|nr:UbiA prenyltransferase family protein [Candidatus Thermoplasmatota archaeon]
MGMIREYLKLSRSFNAGLTGISPVMGAISMGESHLLPLFLLFLVGFFGHVYGFVVNDILDLKVDKLSAELGDRPLVSGKISGRGAWIFAITSMVLSFIIAAFLSFHYYSFFPAFPILVLSALSITIYDLISKKYPAMDVFVGAGIFLLILYGASSIGNLTKLAWIVCGLGTIQVLFMQFIAGGLKDAENDYMAKANTLAIKMGVRVENKKMFVPSLFKVLAYTLQIVDISLLFIALFFIFGFERSIMQIAVLIPLSIFMVFISTKLLRMKEFERDKARTLIGMHYYVNFSLVPVMLTVINPWIALLIFVPFGAFILSNLTLHGTLLQPKTM